MRTAVQNTDQLPVSHYWGLIKGIDRRQKLELATMIMESLRDEEAVARKARLWDPETGECLNDETMKAIEDVRSGKDEGTTYESFEEFRKAMLAL